MVVEDSKPVLGKTILIIAMILLFILLFYGVVKLIRNFWGMI